LASWSLYYLICSLIVGILNFISQIRFYLILNQQRHYQQLLDKPGGGGGHFYPGIRGRRLEKLGIVFIGFVLIWLRASQIQCDVLGGNCLSLVRSMANQNSCYSSPGVDAFTKTESQQCIPSTSWNPAQAKTYHPRGSFPLTNNEGGQSYYELEGIYAFCYLDQHWGASKDDNLDYVKQYSYNSQEGEINCNQETLSPTTSSVPLPGCNTETVCYNSYPSPGYGVKLSSTTHLGSQTSNQTSGEMCPGIIQQPGYWLQNGDPVPINSDGTPVRPYKNQGGPGQPPYRVTQRRPRPLCPLCLWYWMSQVAGTEAQPYYDPQTMALLVSQCFGLPQAQEAISGPSGAYMQGGVPLLPITCSWCPGRSSQLPEREVFSIFDNENYDPINVQAVFWLTTLGVFFLPLGWLILFYILTSTLPT
jgi:hypothetical protein